MKPTLAIVERLPGHTEDMGSYAALASHLGYDTHLFFDRADPVHMIDYFRSRLSIAADHVHEWFEIIEGGAQFDVVLLNTSFVWLDCTPLMQQWNATRRLIVVHHHPDDTELNPFGSAIYLTPAAGEDNWVFPLYGKPAVPPDPEAQIILHSSTGAPELPPLVSIGTFEGKDIEGAVGYMQAGGRLVHYDRHPCHYFPGYGERYRQYVGLDGTRFVASLEQREKPIFLWHPILPERDYLVCRFTAALITGVDLNCVMVMPDRLRRLYRFPEDAVIAYNTTIMESDCLEKLRQSPREQHERRRQLALWAAERWNRDLAVFSRVLGCDGA